MNRRELIALIRQRKSFLCVGLDPDPDRLPAGQDVGSFCRAIVDATRDHCVAYKPNLAFFEQMGSQGWSVLRDLVQYIGRTHLVIADAKRGDIGNTSAAYASACFDWLGCDAVTVSPYMGGDSVRPFLAAPGKWTIVLALTSNPGAEDFELLEVGGESLYVHVVRKALSWGTPDNLMFVVGATRPEQLRHVRSIAPDHFFLVPGIGAQGGSLEEVIHAGCNSDVGILVNASRSILYASDGPDFAKAAAAEAHRLQQEMAVFC